MIDIKSYKKSPILQDVNFDDSPVIVNTCKLVEHPIHFHEHLEVVFVVKGSIVVKASCKEFIIMEGEYIFINAFEYHSIKRTSDEAIVTYMYIHQESSIEDPLLLFDIDILKKDAELFYGIRKEIIDMIKYFNSGNKSETSLESRVNNLMKRLYSNLKYASYNILGERNEYDDRAIHVERLNNIIDYLYFNFDEKLTLSQVADRFNISKYYLSHIVKKGYNMTFVELLNLVRVDRAEHYLLTSNAPISEISLDIGFSSQHYFNKCFKEYFELTPLQYRKKYRKETIQYKAMNEEAYEINNELLDRFLNINNVEMSSDNGAAISIVLGKSDYSVSVVQERDMNINAKTFILNENRKISLNYDGGELVIKIKPYVQ